MDLISRQAAIDAVTSICDSCDSGYCGDCRVSKFIGKRNCTTVLMELPPAQPDNRLSKIAELVEGTIDHFDLDDAMDLLYQIKEIVGNETSNIRG